ncbi:MAG: alanyl-tRNA editing protein [Anaerolineae bacterium]|nr:alanyl-tRNA editing protein [Anaerolineae bacterium]
MTIVATERLYIYDSYLREFAAQVVGRQVSDGKPAIALDRTAFYPTGGGQPNDRGTLAGVPVLDVIVEDGVVWHILAAECPREEVRGVIDWSRRFDHMQQHTGQHILSQAFVVTCDAETVAFHMGADASTIDLNRADLRPDALAAAETVANAVIDAAHPMTATVVTQDELAQLPLRKPPKVTEAIRVVQVAGFDWSACGGTHVANSSQVGLVKITGIERRGSELRVTFLCGGRARADYARLQALASGLATRFTCAQDEVLGAVERLTAEHKVIRKDLADLETQWVEATAAAWWGEAAPQGQQRVILRAIDVPVERAKKLAQALRVRPGALVILGVLGERPQLLFTRADDVSLNMGDLLRTVAAAGGGRGGGRPDWAQGGVPSNEALGVALDAARVRIMNDE